MGIRERKEREKQQRRKTILNTAKELIGRCGVDGMSMNRLAESTELNKATLYLYFSSKDDLIDAIVFEALIELEKQFQDAVARSSNGLDAIMLISGSMFDFYRGYPVYFYTMNHQERRNAAERMDTPYARKGNEKAAALFKILSDCIDRGIADGSIREGIDIESFQMLFFAHIYGVTYTVHSKADIYEDVLNLDADGIESSAREMIACYLRGSST